MASGAAAPDMAPVAVAPAAALTVGSRRIPVVLPTRGDPRLRLSAVIIALQVLGQTVLGFKLSISQILVTVAFAALIELAVVWHRSRILIWPASAILTGNSVAFILRATGTRHGDWWTLHGIQYFLLAVALSLGSKYLIRVRGGHIFNPSNVGLVWVLLVIGPVHVYPQYLRWGPIGTPLTLALIVIAFGAVWVMSSVRMAPMAVAFLFTFGVLVAVAAASGQSFVAVWHSGPVSGFSYWLNICLSPEVLIFVFFMMSDPRTAPHERRAQIAFGAGTAAIAAALLAIQPTEYGVKVAILASLTVTCAIRAAAANRAGVGSCRSAVRSGRELPGLSRGAVSALTQPAILAAMIIAIAVPIDTIALSGDQQISYIEQGLTGTHNPQ
jgi:hypothetical protein